MSDDLTNFKIALQAATPAPDVTRKLANLAIAEKNFRQHQAISSQRRQTSSPSRFGPFKGVTKMFAIFSNRLTVVGTSALVAFGLTVIFPNISMWSHEDLLVDPSGRILNRISQPFTDLEEAEDMAAILRQNIPLATQQTKSDPMFAGPSLASYGDRTQPCDITNPRCGRH
jgi:hypothetical protein